MAVMERKYKLWNGLFENLDRRRGDFRERVIVDRALSAKRQGVFAPWPPPLPCRASPHKGGDRLDAMACRNN
ncbi:hypothetical protein TAL182_CH03456 [Rhizobium sp. TAL182]|nr:hypothetical protein TAL182_CH03456 [Rhizobium sp. TAL182]